MARNRRRRRSQTDEDASERYVPRNAKGEPLTAEERRAAFIERITSPAFTRIWHPDGTEYTDEEYKEAGMEPPNPDGKIDLKQWVRFDNEEDNEEEEEEKD